MTPPRGTPGHGRVWRGFLAAGLVVGGLVGLDRGSTERGNRLYRSGDVSAALEVYQRGAVPDSRAAAFYNLGTALLAIGGDDAESQLGIAVQGADSAAAQRAHYNLGYLFLTGIDPAADADSAVPLLVAAVNSNRAALRMNLGDESARWNLALAQRMLDALGSRLVGPIDNKNARGTRESPGTQQVPPSEFEASTEARGASGEAEGGAEREAQNLQPGDASGQRASIPGGESEAFAGKDPGPLTARAALRLVRDLKDSPEQLVRGLLWSHRPKVAWWNAELFPGGNW
ncbi:MAG: hypothetical protein EXR93_07365 [Gemmatimonadetes bacterium]|nr:hypothetical protein [Gemmatimonadota bacterium]